MHLLSLFKERKEEKKGGEERREGPKKKGRERRGRKGGVKEKEIEKVCGALGRNEKR